MARIVTTTYRYKPPPKRKGRKLAEIIGPAVVVGKGGRRPAWKKAAAGEGMSKSTRLEKAGEAQPITPPERQRDPVVTTARKTPAPTHDGGPRRSAIVTARKPRSWRSDVPDMTPEEHQHRGDAADALFREMKRRIGKV